MAMAPPTVEVRRARASEGSWEAQRFSGKRRTRPGFAPGARPEHAMSKLNQKWIVQPHGDLIALADGLLTVEGSIVMPLGTFPRRMTVLALHDGGSAIWSPIPLREAEMSRIEALGPVRFLIVPNRGHRLDLKPLKNRYPGARIIAPLLRGKLSWRQRRWMPLPTSSATRL
jgi:hypothetical protein